MKKDKKQKTDKIYVCDRCEITTENRGDTMCPCPRGGCEARQVSIPQKLYTRNEIHNIIDEHFANEYIDADVEVLKRRF